MIQISLQHELHTDIKGICHMVSGSGREDRAAAEPDSLKLSSSQPGPFEEVETNGTSKGPENLINNELPEAYVLATSPLAGENSQDVVMTDVEISEQIDTVKRLLMERTEDYGVPQLERLYTRVIKSVIAVKSKEGREDHKLSIVRHLLKFVEDDENF